jgi:hypothetical protein
VTTRPYRVPGFSNGSKRESPAPPKAWNPPKIAGTPRWSCRGVRMGQSEQETFPYPRGLGHIHTGKGGRRRGNIFQMGMGGPGNFPLCSPYVVRHDSWAVAAACCHTCRVAGTSSLNLSPLYQTTSAKYWSTQAPLLLAISQPLCIGDPLGEEMRLDAALSTTKRPSTRCWQAAQR